jgi:yecA family protein
MTMFTSKEKANLTKLLDCAINKEEVLSIDGLHGFLYGLAIIPEPIPPSEWLPGIFGKEMFELENGKNSDSLLDSLFSAYNLMVRENEDENLVFPYNIGTMKEGDIQRIQEWAHGFITATMICPSIWGMDDELLDGLELAELDNYDAEEIFGDDAGSEITAVDDLVEEEYIDGEEPFDDEEFDEFDEANEAEDIAASYAVVMAIAFPDRIPEIFDSVEHTELKNAKRDPKLLAGLFSLLPDAIANLQKYANTIRYDMEDMQMKDGTADNYNKYRQQPLNVEKIGRNNPCPCGSGKKFKKCCGK